MLNIKSYYNNIFGSECLYSDDYFFNKLRLCFEKQVAKGQTKFIIYPLCNMTVKAIEILKVYFGIEPLFIADNHCSLNDKVIKCENIDSVNQDCTVVIVDNRYENYDSVRQELYIQVSNKRIVDAFPIKPLYRKDSRIISFEMASREIYRNNILGDVAELGVYRGYTAEFINEFFPDRTFHMFDTFSGFDSRDCYIESSKKYSNFTPNSLFKDTSIQIVLDKMAHKDNCIFHKGYFPDTTVDFDESIKFSFVHLDADLYAPIYSGLLFFYKRLSVGGYIFVHDFNGIDCKGVREAVQSFCRKEGIGYVCLPDSIEKGTAVITKGKDS